MSNLIRQSQLNLDAASRGGMFGRRPVPRDVLRRAEDEAYEAVIACIRARGAGLVAYEGLTGLATLTRAEAQFINSIPMEDLNARLKAESRSRLLLDAYTTVVGTEIARMAW